MKDSATPVRALRGFVNVLRHRGAGEDPWRDCQNLIGFETCSFFQLPRRYPRDFTFYVADPISSIHGLCFLSSGFADSILLNLCK